MIFPYLGLRKAALAVIPASFPNAQRIGQLIDQGYAQKYYQEQNPRLDFPASLFSRIKYAAMKALNDPLSYKGYLIRETLEEVLRESASYSAYREWVKRLELESYQTQVRPSIDEFYVLGDDEEVIEELSELISFRRRLRQEPFEGHPLESQMRFFAFPEQRSAEFVERMGRLLGYPQCCVEAYVDDLQSGLIPEVRSAEQIETYEGEGMEVVDKAFYLYDFVPCTPDCIAAREKASQALQRLGEIDPRLHDKYEALLGNYVERIKDYPEMVEARREQLQEQMERPDRRG